MLGVFNLILLFGMCTMVTPSGFFFVSRLKSYKGDDETLIDFSKLRNKQIFNPFRNTYVAYLTGPIAVNSELNDTFQSIYIYYSNVTGSDAKTVSLCDFFNNEYQKHFLPLAMNHNDFPSKSGGSYCPIKSGEYNILKVDKNYQLDTPTDIPISKEYQVITIKFILNQKLVGGFGALILVYKVTF